MKVRVRIVLQVFFMNYWPCQVELCVIYVSSISDCGRQCLYQENDVIGNVCYEVPNGKLPTHGNKLVSWQHIATKPVYLHYSRRLHH